MIDVTYIAHDGTSRTIQVAQGTDLRASALASDVPGIDGDCGGAGACATCRVRVDSAWTATVGPPNEDEREILELVDGEITDFRLSCQIIAREALHGLVLHTPESQR